MIYVKSVEEIEKMRLSCNLASRVLEYIKPYVKADISTLELNDLCHEFIIKNGAKPATLNYKGFPKSICTSLNNVICHGIPNRTEILKNGDILNIDVTVNLDGFFGDTNYTFLVGKVNPRIRQLVSVTYDCMMAGIETVKEGAYFGDIGASIKDLADKYDYGVVTDYCGHGIGRRFHEDPQVKHVGKWGQGPMMKAGMIFTVEPMINQGRKETRTLKDKWTAVTVDDKYSAQFEHTVLVTPTGYEILTPFLVSNS